MKKSILMSLLFIVNTSGGLCIYDDYPGTVEISSKRDYLKEAREATAQLGNIYDPEPTSRNAPLTPELVLNTYWRSLQSKPQEQKDAALKTILDMIFTDNGYHLARYHYAAAAFIGTNINSIFSERQESVLLNATMHQDYALCKLLFACGADPNKTPKMYDSFLPLTHTVLLAQLFLDAGSRIDTQSYSYLQSAMYESHNPLLVRWYIAQGVNPLAKNDFGLNALHSLLTFLEWHTIGELQEKVSYFFETLDFYQTSCVVEQLQKSIKEDKQTEKTIWLYNYLQEFISKTKLS